MAAFLSRRARQTGQGNTRRALRGLEPLEPRTLLAVATWVAPTDGFWDVASNWLNDQPPQDGDDVVIRVPTADITVTYRGLGASIIGGLNNQERFVIQSGSAFKWAAGQWAGGGSVAVESGATLEITGGAPKELGRLNITNDGTLLWTGGEIGLPGGQVLLVNGTSATFEIQTDADVVGRGGRLTFENRGRIAKTAGAGETVLVPGATDFTTTGLVEVQTGALGFDSRYVQLGFPATETRLSGGNLRFGQGADLNAGRLTGEGTIFGNLINGGATIAPGDTQIGVLTIVGNFAVVPATAVSLPTLDMQVNGNVPGTEIDQLVVRQTPDLTGGNAALGGVLSVTVTGVTPLLGDRYPLIDAFATTGKFISTVLPTIPPNTFWLVDYGPQITAIEVVDTLADLTLTMTASPTTARVDQVLVYRATVTNAGPNGAANVIITDVLAPGLDFVPEDSTASAQYNPATRTVTVNLGFFSVGASGTARIAVRPTTAFVGSTIINTAVASSDEPDPDRTNNTATVEVPLVGTSSLSVDVTGPASVGVGQPITYVVTVRNNGPSVASNVNVATVLPRNSVYRPELSTAGLTVNTNGTAVIASVGTLGVGSTAQFRVVVVPTVANSGQTIGTIVVAASNETTTDPAQDSATTSVLAAPEVVGIRRVAGSPGQLIVRFNQPMDPLTAANLANYDLRVAGPDGRLNTPDDRVIRIRSAVYNATNNWVRLSFRGHLSPYRRNFLRVSAQPGALMNLQNIPLAGNGSGFPGFDYLTRFVPSQVPVLRPS